MQYQVGSDGERHFDEIAARTAHPLVRTRDSMPEGALHAVPPGASQAACGKASAKLFVFERDWMASPRLDRCPVCVDAVAAAADADAG